MAARDISTPWVKLALEMTGSVLERMDRMTHGSGSEVVEKRDAQKGDYRYWDLETLKVDKELEDCLLDRLADAGIDAVALSEEAGRRQIEPRTAPEIDLDRPVFFACDPFDGSLLYKRDIPAFWFSAFSFYTRPDRIEVAEPLTAVVVDVFTRRIYYCDMDQSYEGVIDNWGKMQDRKVIAPRKTTSVSEAFLESYMMKPLFMYPTAEQFKFLLESVKFILPNGGPCGFCDVASGRIDIYLAHKQPHNDVFPGLPIAAKAGCRISTFEGKPVVFDDDVGRRHNILCTATDELHEKVLKMLADNGIDDNTGIEED